MTHASTLALHQLALGELAPDRADAVRTHLADCDRCRARLAAVEAEAAAFDDALPPALAALDAAPAPAHWLLFLRRLAPAAVALAAAALLIVASPALLGPGEPSPAAGTRTRGTLPALEVWIDGPSGVRPLRADEPVAPGDRVQLLVDAHGAARIGLAGRDGTGAVEVYGVLVPEGEGLHPAPFGLALDDAPGPQVFYAVTGGADLDEAAVRAAVREVPLPDHVIALELAKQGRPR